MQTCAKRVTHTVVCGEPATHRLGKHGMWEIGDGALCEQHAHLAQLAGYDIIRLEASGKAGGQLRGNTAKSA